MALQGTLSSFSKSVLNIIGLERLFAAGGVFQQASYMASVTQNWDGQVETPSATQTGGGQVRDTSSA